MYLVHTIILGRDREGFYQTDLSIFGMVLMVTDLIIGTHKKN